MYSRVKGVCSPEPVKTWTEEPAREIVSLKVALEGRQTILLLGVGAVEDCEGAVV